MVTIQVLVAEHVLLAERVLQAICVAIASLGSIRFILLGGLAVVYWARTRRPTPERIDDSYHPFVTVLVPAHNEERVIGDTIQSVLGSEYQPLEVVIVDDGSRDGTADVVRERFRDDARVRLFVQARRGKAG